MNSGEDEIDYNKFNSLTFEDFRRRAKDEKLTRYEKIGFPDSYRKGYEGAIFKDIESKLKGLREKSKTILDIGCGCSGLSLKILEVCEKNSSKLLLVDSGEMLSLLPDKPFIEKFPGRFPDCCQLLEKYKGNIDAIIVYSVIQSVFIESTIFAFLDKACELLKDGGEMLIGDIPNVSKRKRFFSSKSGIKCHQKFTGKNELPRVEFTTIENNKIDDGVLFGLLQRYRNFGFDTYLLPQDKSFQSQLEENIF